MKKFLRTMLVACLIVPISFMLAACGTKSGGDEDTVAGFKTVKYFQDNLTAYIAAWNGGGAETQGVGMQAIDSAIDPAIDALFGGFNFRIHIPSSNVTVCIYKNLMSAIVPDEEETYIELLSVVSPTSFMATQYQRWKDDDGEWSDWTVTTDVYTSGVGATEYTPGVGVANVEVIDMVATYLQYDKYEKSTESSTSAKDVYIQKEPITSTWAGVQVNNISDATLEIYKTADGRDAVQISATVTTILDGTEGEPSTGSFTYSLGGVTITLPTVE